MKSGFYPYSGPAGRDDPSRPYPSWYYPEANGAAFIVHNIQEYLTAVDFFYRSVFGQSSNILWFLGINSGTPTLLPQVLAAENTFNENTDIAGFSANISDSGAFTYPQLLVRMALAGIPTRLIEWTANALEALIFAVSSGDMAAPATVFALNPFGLNRNISDVLSDPQEIPEASSPEISPLFGKTDGSVGAGRPFAVFAQNGDGRHLFTVFPRVAGTLPIERLPDSAQYLFKIQVPPELRSAILRQLTRLGMVN